MKRIYMMKRIYILALFTLIAAGMGRAESAVSVLNNALAKVKGAHCISCNFKLKADGHTLPGTLKSDGRCFVIETPQGTSWFDGSTMWTSNPATREITIVTPTASEIAEANPMSYMSANTADFKIGFSSRKDTSNWLVLLNPKKKNNQIKAVEIGINKKTGWPTHVVVRDSSDKRVTLTITSISPSKNLPASSFKCPVGNYKGYELVDLR